jgi:amino acid adenylation domain-containing protein
MLWGAVKGMHSQMNSQVLRRDEAILNVWPLTSEQEDQWLLEQLYPGSSAHNLRSIYKLTGVLNIDALEKSLNEIVSRHDILRAYFPLVAGEPVQRIRPYEPVQMNVKDISHLPELVRKEELEKHYRAVTELSFDLASDQLFRVGIIKYSAEEHVLAAAFHHIIFDGWSRQLFHMELAQHYKHFLENSGEGLKPLHLQYTAYAEQQLLTNTKESQEQDMTFWRQQLGGDLPELNLLPDYVKTARTSLVGSECHFTIKNDLYHAVKSICREENSTKFILFMTVLKIMLFRYTGQEDLIIGCPVSGRNEQELEPLLGVFIKTLAIRTQLSEDMTAREALHTVQAVFRESFKHQNVPFGKLVAELAPTRQVSARPFFQVMINKHNMSSTYDEMPGLQWEELVSNTSAAIVDVTLKLNDYQGQMNCCFVYNQEVFKLATIERMAGHFQTLLHGFIENLDQPISLLPILPETEKHEILYEWNAAIRSTPPQTSIHELFEDRVNQHPDRVALTCGHVEMTYAELNCRANQIANYLQASGLPNEGLVGVYLDRSPEAVYTFMGILKAGGAYVPIDSGYPADRVALMLGDANVHCLITVSHLSKQLPPLEAPTIQLDLDADAISLHSDANLPSISGPQSLAYVLYTSGSTGRPKGVAVPHLGIVRLVIGSEFLTMGPEETFLQLTSLSFDPSGLEIYGSLLNGGRAAIISMNQPSLKLIAETIRDHRVTILNSNPDLVNLLMDDYSEEIKGLTQVISGGDILPVWLARKFQSKLPNSQFINVYGPTENSVITTTYAIKPITDEVSISIGRPIANDAVYILDKHLQPVPVGVVGELYLAGDGVARGYLNNEALSSEKFIPNPYSDVPDSMMYKTGDLARFQPDRSVDFLGRIDHQVKIRGCRIELGEVEVVLNDYLGVQQAVAHAWKSEEGGQKLVAYMVMQAGTPLDQQKLRSFVQERLPQYMIPTFIVELDQIPMTSVGKLDRKRLPSPITSSMSTTMVPARNDVERKLARIWERLLKFSPVSVQDNFFDLGGHSLLAMQLFSEIEITFQKKMPVSIIFHEDTIEKQAKLLMTSNTSDEPASSLVAIQPRGSRKPIYCIHELSGEVILYWNLAQRLGEDQPVYGIRYAMNDDSSKITIQDLATRYIRDIQDIQPNGPYCLLGFSLGGLIAYEMAQQLQSRNEEVSLLAIVDARNPTSYPSSKHRIVKRIKDNVLIFFKIPNESKVKFMKEKIHNAFVKRDLLTNSPGEEAEARARGFLGLTQTYDTRPYSGTIAFFRADHDYSNLIVDEKHGWEISENGVLDVYKVPSDHTSILNEPHVALIASSLKAYL